MAITTKVARHYAIRMHAIAIVSVVFSLWGAYDLWIKKRKERAAPPRGIPVGGRVSITPTVGPGGVGLSGGFSF